MIYQQEPERFSDEAEFLAGAAAFERLEPLLHLPDLPRWTEASISNCQCAILDAAYYYRPTTRRGLRALARLAALEFHSTGDSPGAAFGSLIAVLGAEALLEDGAAALEANPFEAEDDPPENETPDQQGSSGPLNVL